MTARLICEHRRDRSETTGSHSGCQIPLHQCGYFGDLCSTALPTEEGYRCCKFCDINPFNSGRRTPRPKTGISIRVRKQNCRAKCQWAWAVILDGVVKASGNEETEAEAIAVAEQEARELREIYQEDS